MNQLDYMRGALEALSHIDSDEKTERFVFRAETLLEQALAHVNETSKNEHENADVLNKTGNVDVMREALLLALPVMERAEQIDGMLSHAVEIETVKNALAIHASGSGEIVDHVPDATKMMTTARLVRLTDDEIAHEYSKADAYLMMCDHYEFGLVANAIQDALAAKNGGQQ